MDRFEKLFSEDFKVNERQKTIIKGLMEQTFSTKNLANMYIGALKVLSNKSNPERRYQSAHSLRELVYYMTDHIKVATKKDETHKEQMQVFINQFDELGGIDKEVIAKQWYDLHDYFVNLCHHRSKARIEDFENNMLKLEYILLALLGPVYETIEELDSLIDIENPTKEDVEKVKALIKKQSHYRNFFKNLYHPNWLNLLAKNGFFDRPPQAGEYSVEPLYLVKIADKNPIKVANIIKKLSKTTHEGAQVEFMKALLKIPVNESIKLKKSIKRWIYKATSSFFALSEEVFKFIIKLFDVGEKETAFELINAIITIKEERYLDEIDANDMSSEIKSSIEGYIYEEIVKKLLPKLIQIDPLVSIKIFSNKLEVAIKLDLKKHNQSFEGDDDNSLHWRRLIDEHDFYTYSKNIRNALVNAIRDLILFIGGERKTNFIKAIKILREYNFLIFRRLELFAIRAFPELSKSYINDAISNRTYFNELDVILEFNQLLEERYPYADPEVQQIYFKWVEEGPNIESYKEICELNWGKLPSEDEIQSFIRRWIIKKLAPIKSYSPKDLITKHKIKDEEFERVGPFRNLPKIQFGPISPINDDELKKMSVQEVLKYLENYQEPEKSLTASKIGLGRTLRNVVELKPQEFTSITSEFLKSNVLHKYISFLLDGFNNAIKNKKEFEWDPVIFLCKSILVNDNNEIEISDEPLFYKENTLRNIKTSIGWLLVNSLKIKESSMPITLKNDVWAIIKVIMDDKEPTLEEEISNIKGNWLLRDMSFNTIRGIAMNAVIEYGLWYAKSIFENSVLNDDTKSKLMPEVKDLLEKHLDYNIDPSFTVRYIYGLNLNRMIYLDKIWVLEHLNSILPIEVDKQEYWEAAWSGYLFGNVINQPMYEILREHYDKALELLNKEGLNVKMFHFSVEKLAEDIMRLYVNGIEDLKSKNSLINKFFQRASDEVRRLAVAYIGQNLLKMKSLENFELVLKKLMELWEYRLFKIKKSKVDDSRQELVFFSFWFINSIFDKEWTILRFEETLNLTRGSIDVFIDVLDIFLNYVEEFPQNVMNCLEMIIKNGVENNGYLLFQEKYRPLLKIILQSENQEAKDKARDLIDYLGRRDLHYFRDLLKKE